MRIIFHTLIISIGMVSVLELMEGGFPSRTQFSDLYQMYVYTVYNYIRKYPYRKHKLVCGCYKVVDKVNYNLVATLLQGCDNLVSTL